MSGAIVPFVDLKRSGAEALPAVEEAVRRVLASGWYVLGPEVTAFEQEFACTMAVSEAVGVASGTDAISLALEACGVGPGDEVLTSPLSAAFTALAITRIGARPVFVDVDPETLNLSPDEARGRITERTKAIVPVHLYGGPCDLETVGRLAREKGLRLVEDAAQAHGARFEGKPVGGFGQAGCFSFYPTKNLGALGDGGMVVTDDAALAGKVRRLRNGGQSSRYVHEVVGINSRLDEMQAAILRAKLPHLSAWNDERGRIADRYRRGLAESAVSFVDSHKDADSAHHLCVVRAPERDALVEFLDERDVQTLIHYPIPIHLQEAYRDLGQGEGSCPVAEAAAAEIVSLPLYPGILAEHVERVIASVRAFYER